jgi:D-glycero-D-manno-heptose 1,7-bisphosphate phosphatase
MVSMTPTLFLDRDGIINVDHAYVFRQENFHFVDGIFELVAAAKEAGFLVVVVTNQTGIGRGYYSEADFHQLMDWVRGQFARRGGTIDGVYFCPHHPEYGLGQFRQHCACRKPGPGMFLQAAADLGIDMAASIMVGDKESDMRAGLAAGVGTLVLFGEGSRSDIALPVNSLMGVVPLLKNCFSQPVGHNIP